jgi:transposase InsO family protein
VTFVVIFIVESLGRSRYFVTFIDARSRYCDVFFIKKKSDVVETTINYIERMKTQLGRKPKIFRSDRGTEYTDQKLQTYLLSEGIKFEWTVGYCPEQNKIAERKNRTLVEAARSMLSDSGLLKNHWAEAVNYTSYIQNRIINRVSGKSPYEKMFEKEPRWNVMISD